MDNLRKQLLSGIFFTALAKYANLVISLIVTAVLARLLAPDQFGVVAIASVAIAFLNLMTDIGLSPTVIQHKELTHKSLGILFSISCYIAAGLAASFYLLAGAFSDWYNQPLLKPICQLLSISIFFSGITVIPNALFFRERLFKPIAIRSLVIQVLGGAIAIIAARKGLGVYALVIGPIFSSLLLFVFSYVKFPLKFSFYFSIKPVRHVFSYSLFQFLFNFINYFSRNADTILIGKYLGVIPLGYYDKSYRLMSLPLQNITQVITPVIHPILSQKGKDIDYLNRANIKLVGILALIGFPLSVFLFFSASELILLFFGPQWELAIPAFRVLSLSVGIQLILSSSGSIFQTAGDTRSLFICGLFSAIINVSGIVLGVFYFKNIEAVAKCLLVTFTINFVQTYWLMYQVILKQSIYAFLNCLWKPIIFALVMSLILYKIDMWFDSDNLFYSLLIKSMICIIACSSLVWFGGYRNDLVEFFRKKK